MKGDCKRTVVPRRLLDHLIGLLALISMVQLIIHCAGVTGRGLAVDTVAIFENVVQQFIDIIVGGIRTRQDFLEIFMNPLTVVDDQDPVIQLHVLPLDFGDRCRESKG